MENERELIYLAALLHDIGKFYQRADKSFTEKEEELSESSIALLNEIRTIDECDRFGYMHAIWTHEFIEKYKAKFETILGITQCFQTGECLNADNFVNLACNPNIPKSKLQAIISLADLWSMGSDGVDATEIENEQPEDQIKWGKERYKKVPLHSVFNKLNGGAYQSVFGLHPLTLDSDWFFPNDLHQHTDGVDQEKYAKLWMQFEAEFNKLPDDSYRGFSESLLFLLKKYAWCIPANTNEKTNVGLFDHMKTTAAFADCLYSYEKENPGALEWDQAKKTLRLKEEVLPILLVGGDISGIQKFIYNIAFGKAAVSLKGRSFYLQLLIDSIIQRIISHEAIDASLGHVVYSSGGKFYMLLPNTQKVTNALQSLKINFEKYLWEEHQGQLILNLDFVPFAYNDKSNDFSFDGVSNKNMGDLWKSLADRLTDNKNHKFSSLLMSESENLFLSKSVDEHARVCAVTGLEGSCEKLDDKETDDPIYVLPIVKEQVKLGTTLKGVDYILTHKAQHKSETFADRAKCSICIADINNHLFNKKELIKDEAEFRDIPSVDIYRVKMVNNLNFLDAKIKGRKASYGFQFYGGNKQARRINGDDKTFTDLADNSYLGILRMDVDGLGSIFIKGLPDDMRSFALYSTLSFMLDYFFSGYLNTIREKYKDDVNILYSGGDDVFAVGQWHQLILFAADIRNEFKRFVGREDISVSGGLAIVRDNFPIAKAAELSGEAEEKAKRYNNGEKDAFNFFGENISWKNEYLFVKEWADRFYTLCVDKKINMSRSILHKLNRYAMIIKANSERERRGEKKDLSYYWNTAYYLTRFSQRYSGCDEIKCLCKELKDDILMKGNRNYELLAVAARWAELRLRD